MGGGNVLGTIIDAATGDRRGPQQVRDRALRMAASLRRLGVACGDRVAVLSHNRIEVFELLAACRHLGAVLVPMNWRLTATELCAIVEDAAPTVVLYDPELSSLARTLGLPLVSIDAIGDRTPPDDSAPASSSADAAMLLYTSGTTGLPKGVVLPWRQIDFNAQATSARLQLGADDRCLAFMPLFHTGGLHCLATPLLSVGGTVVVMPRFDAERALDIMDTCRITCVIGVPTIYEMLLEAGLAARELPRLRHLLVGGAAPLPHLFDGYAAAGHALSHGYGLTEAGPNCFSFGSDGTSVGRPMPGTEATVATDGELLLRGPHTCLGYWNKPAATRDLLGDGPGDHTGWLRTGDIAERSPAGDYRIVGRKKEIYISGGENVYPAEVERVLSTHPGVAEVCVLGVPDARWGEVGAAVVVPREGRKSAVSDIQRYAKERLARFKVPKHWHLVPSLPKGTTGKVQRLELARSLRATEKRP